MDDAREEAAALLSSVVKSVLDGDVDTIKLLRRCAHACRLLGWNDRLAWCQQELGGYPTDAPLPRYRASVVGTHAWLVEGGIQTAIEATVSDMYQTRSIETTAPAYMAVPNSLPVLLSLAKSGYDKRTGERRERELRSFHRAIGEYEVERYSADAFQHVVNGLESELFAFASQSYVLVRYENVIEQEVANLQSIAGTALSELGLTSHFQAITECLAADNPERWRQAMNECRNALQDTARALWQDPRGRYDPIPDPSGQGIPVTDDRFVNRLRAYLHQKGRTSDKRGRYILSQLDNTVSAIRALVDLESTAHAPVELPEVRLAVVGTYLVLAELALRTDLKPVAHYVE